MPGNYHREADGWIIATKALCRRAEVECDMAIIFIDPSTRSHYASVQRCWVQFGCVAMQRTHASFHKDALARTDPHLSFNYLHDEIQLSQGHDEKSALR